MLLFCAPHATFVIAVARQFVERPSTTEQQPPRVQRIVHVRRNGLAEIAQRAAFDVDEAVPVLVRERVPQLRRADRLPRAADQALPRVERPSIERGREPAALHRCAQPRMRRAQMAIGATRDFRQPVEHRVAGQFARGRIFHIKKVFAVRFAVAHDQARVAERDGR
ncbi:hypothetical protein KTE49_30125 [Burkholderia multivorans]|uniref:hypothetical protein n=1 Tax=Burkholderia multivorans TaxID=87883 RepID=UPI001589F084|nr:hypothetical protein [Burkholderia multivorans]MBU9327019.1 hypothetical protein [Burkholderia multivorans]MBU9534694.1 hypothetical protein [Burkholderia multivorans]